MSTDLITISGATMGTRYAVTLLSSMQFDRAKLERDLLNAVGAIDQQMSPWIVGSVINRVNAAPVSEWVTIPSQTSTVIEKALEIEAKSNAAFSIAVADQVRHFGFSTQPRGMGHAPKLITTAYDSIELDGDRLRKTQPVSLDLCGIAKGYGVDALADTLIGYEIADFMASIDGELRCQGAPNTHEPWQVALELPLKSSREMACVIPCEDLALATSGGYRHFAEIDKITVTHTINPRTGTPLEYAQRSVTVAHKNCCDADAWATALLVMPEVEADAIVEREGLNALLLLSDGVKTRCKPFGAFAAF